MRTVLLSLAPLALLACLAAAPDAEEVQARLHSSGLLEISRGGTALAVIELSAHGPGWEHAPQKTAVAEIAELPDGEGKVITGVLAVPNTAGGSVRYVQTTTALPRGLRLDYDLTMSKAMKLNGLQFSVNLPVVGYGGEEVMIYPAFGDPQVAGLPEAAPEDRFILWQGQGARVEVAGETDREIVIEMVADADVVVQDLRRWENPVFEIRLPAIMEGGGWEVKEGERFHLQVTLGFAHSVRLEGP